MVLEYAQGVVCLNFEECGKKKRRAWPKRAVLLCIWLSKFCSLLLGLMLKKKKYMILGLSMLTAFFKENNGSSKFVII